MEKFKQFMDIENFENLTKSAMRTHMSKPEVVQIMRARALKHSDMADHDQAMRYIVRAEDLAARLLPNPEHMQALLVKSTKVEILLKKLSTGREGRLPNDDDFNEPI